jgi:hypothetical protein
LRIGEVSLISLPISGFASAHRTCACFLAKSGGPVAKAASLARGMVKIRLKMEGGPTAHDAQHGAQNIIAVHRWARRPVRATLDVIQRATGIRAV